MLTFAWNHALLPILPTLIEPILFWLSRVTLCPLEMTVHSLTQWLWSRKLAASVEPVGRSAFGCSGCYPRSRLNCLLLTQLQKKQVSQLWCNTFFFFFRTLSILSCSLMIHSGVQTYIARVMHCFTKHMECVKSLCFIFIVAMTGVWNN